MAGVDVRISELPLATEAHPDDRFETTQVDGATLVSRSITLDQVSDAVAAILPPPAADWASITGKPTTFPPTVPIAWTDVSGKPSTFPPTLPIAANGVTLPAGAVGYGAAGNTLAGVANDLAWDATNKRLGIGVAAPAYKVQVQQSGGDIFTVDNSGIIGTAGAVRALLPFNWPANGQYWASLTIGTTSGGYLGLFGGTGAPTLSTFGAYGSIYVNASSPGIPYYNNNGGTGWDQLVGLTATQTLTNKTITGYLASGASAGGDLAGTYPNPTIKPGSNTQVLTTTGGVAVWAAPAGGSGTVTSTSVVSANGFAGTVATATSTPAITLSTTISGILKGNATAISAAVSGTDYLPATGGTGVTTLGTIATGTWQGSLIAGQYGGTGVANTGKTIALGGNLTTSGAFASTFTMTGTTAVTFPTSGTLLTTASPGTLLQMVSTVTGAVATGTTVIPFDDTIPQQTEGDQYMSLAITPKSATSKLVISVVVNATSSFGGAIIIAASLFQDATANALAAAWQTMSASSLPVSIAFRHVMTSGTTSATTFKVRVGANSAATTTFNGQAGGRIYGGVMASSIVIEEVA